MKRSLAVMVVASSCSLPNVAATPFTQPAPPTTAIEVCWLETGGVEVSGGFGAAGSVRADTWQVTSSALLVKHPKGDLLIDTGTSKDPEADAEGLSSWGRFIFGQTAARNVPRGELAGLVKAAGSSSPSGVVLSHAHADHAGGVGQLPGVPVWLAKEEKAFVESGSEAVLPGHRKALEGRMQAIEFAARGYSGFPESWDVYDDGAVVVVPVFGHTPGSVAVFVNLGARRLIHVGDLINLQESVDREVPKSWAMSTLTDEDRGATEREVARLVRLQKQDPGLWILPAHDRVAYEAFFGRLPLDVKEPRCVTQ